MVRPPSSVGIVPDKASVPCLTCAPDTVQKEDIDEKPVFLVANTRNGHLLRSRYVNSVRSPSSVGIVPVSIFVPNRERRWDVKKWRIARAAHETVTYRDRVSPNSLSFLPRAG